jgi:hypothetical protein
MGVGAGVSYVLRLAPNPPSNLPPARGDDLSLVSQLALEAPRESLAAICTGFY